MATSTISVTELDFDDIKQSLKNYLSSRSEFTDYNFEGSTINILLDLLSYNTYQNAFYSSMVGNEMFLDSAQLRDSVVSRAKMLSYTPRSARGASTTLDVAITPSGSPASVTVSKNTEFTATVDGEEYIFVTPQDYVLTSVSNYSGTITITEGRPLTQRYTVSTANPVKYLLPNANADTTSLKVTVQESAVDLTTTTYILANDLTEVSSTSTVYFLQESEDQEYEIYFGDGVLGKALTNGNIVIIEYRVCNGAVGNDISTFTNPSTLGGSSTFTVTVNGSTSGGSAAETIESIKFNAPKNFETQNRAVTAEDYKRIILRDNGDFSSVNVWGGEENDPPIYGKVYISVKPTSGTIITNDRKNTLKTELKKYNVLTTEIEFVDAFFLYVVPTIKVFYNSDNTTNSASTIQQNALAAVVSYETNNLGTFEANKFRYSKFVEAIDDSNTAITGNNITLEIEKRFIPTIGSAVNYTIVFNNKLYAPHSGHQYTIRSSSFTYQGRTCYLDDDGAGNIRVYYFNSSNVRTYLTSTVGTVNYETGVVNLLGFNISAYSGTYLSIFAEPRELDVNAVRNQILLISGAGVSVTDEATKQLVAATVTATTTGVTTDTVETGINSIVY